MKLLSVILPILLLCACSVKIYDLQPYEPATETPKPFYTLTPFATQPPEIQQEISDQPIEQTENLKNKPVYLLDLKMIDGGTGWGIGYIKDDRTVEDDGIRRVLRTTDGANTWKDVTPQEIRSSIRNMIASAFFLDELRGWVTYWSPAEWETKNTITIWHTEDGGETWSGANLPQNGYTMQFFRNPQIGFIDSGIGWIFASIGTETDQDCYGLYTTFDNGNTWKAVVTSDSGNLPSSGTKNGAVFRNPLEGWISGDNSGDDPAVMLWHTYDGGNTWDPQSIPYLEIEGLPSDILESAVCSFSTPQFMDLQSSYAWSVLHCQGGSLREPVSILYLSFDTLKSWQTALLPKAEGSLFFFDIDHGWYSQESDPDDPSPYEIMITIDHGKTWDVAAQTEWFGRPQFITPTIGFGMIDYYGIPSLVRTERSGYSWEQIDPILNP